MLYSFSYLENMSLVYLYMTIYNYSILMFLWVIASQCSNNNKSLFSLNKFSFNTFHVLLFTIVLLSIAGVPPFIGFFSKLFIIVLLLNSNIAIFYIFFIIILVIGLYFYMQNIRLLHSSNKLNNNAPQFLANEYNHVNFYTYSLLIIFMILFGFTFIDDFLIFSLWLLL